MVRKLISFVLLILFSIACSEGGGGTGGENPTDISGEYFGQAVPGNTPQRLAVGEFLAQGNWFWHGPPEFSPDMQEVFFSKIINSNLIQLNYSKMVNGVWQVPEPINFTSPDECNNPRFSADGNTLYYISRNGSGYIFKSERNGNAWGAPSPVSVPTGSFSVGWQFDMADNGNLYLDLQSGGDYNLYCSQAENGLYQSPEELTDLQTSGTEITPYIHPNEDYLIFASNRAGGYGMHDLYVSFKQADGSWGQAINLGAGINTTGEDAGPNVTPDGQYLIYTTERSGDHGYNPYWVSIDVVESLRPDGVINPPISSAGVIAYVSGRDGNWEIYTMNEDGSAQTRLTSNSANDHTPLWSPDGNKILFVSGRNGNEDIFVMDSDGSNQVCLTASSAHLDAWPDWSPDGTQIVFSSDRDGYIDLYKMNADGTNIVRLSNTVAEEFNARWSPDGNEIVYVYLLNDDFSINTMNTDGSGVEVIANRPGMDVCPVYSPDGTQIIFVSNGTNNQEDIFIMNRDGSDLHPVIATRSNDFVPCWSPEGNKIAYQGYSGPGGNDDDIYVYDIALHTTVKLTTSRGWDSMPDWK